MSLLIECSDNVMEAYEEATDQCEGDLHLLAFLIIFFEPKYSYSETKMNFDSGQDIEKYHDSFERINNMKPKEVKTFIKSYYRQVDGGMAFLREAVVDEYKQILPKDKKVCDGKKPSFKLNQTSLF